MSRAGMRMGIGTRFVYDGEVVEVIEMQTVGASLEVLTKDARASVVRRFGLEELFSDRARILNDTTEEVPGDRIDVAGAVLSCLSAEQRQAVSKKASHIREVLTGYRSGYAQVAFPGEPRRQYAPDLPLGQRYAAKAAEIGKSYRTIESWVKAYRSDGKARLVPKRAIRSGAGSRVDSRWTETALEVMVEHTDMSRPTGALVINHSSARLIARNGEGAIRLPSKATAYRALQALDAQYPTFRQNRKRNRDVAARSTEEYGKLRPTRPGEYMLMDTTRLDVFAMDPVTLRWVGVDLTVAMDWYSRCIPMALGEYRRWPLTHCHRPEAHRPRGPVSLR